MLQTVVVLVPVNNSSQVLARGLVLGLVRLVGPRYWAVGLEPPPGLEPPGLEPPLLAPLRLVQVRLVQVLAR